MTILPKKKPPPKDKQSDSESEGEEHKMPPIGHNSPGMAAGASLPSPYMEERQAYSSHRHSSAADDFYSTRSFNSEESNVSPRPKPYGSPNRSSKSQDWEGAELSGYNSSEEYDASRRGHYDEERERLFEQALKKERGFTIQKTEPDGACLFRAIAEQVYGDQEMHSAVRQLCMDYMVKNADYFSNYVTEDFAMYVNRKRSEHCMGNHIEMQAMAEMFNRNIEVYQYSTEPINIFHGMYKTDNAPIRLSYHQNLHYNAVIDPYEPSVGVGLGLAGYKTGLGERVLPRPVVLESEQDFLEKQMLEDKMKSSDAEATFDAIEESVAKESYLLWLKEQATVVGEGSKKGESSSSVQKSISQDGPAKLLLPPSTLTQTKKSQSTNCTSVSTTLSPLPTPAEFVGNAAPTERQSRRSSSRINPLTTTLSPYTSPCGSPDSCHKHLPRECRSWPCSRSSSVSSNHRPLSSARSTGNLKGKSSSSKKDSGRCSPYGNHRHSPYPSASVKRTHGSGVVTSGSPATSPKLKCPSSTFSSKQHYHREGQRAEASLPSPLPPAGDQNAELLSKYPFEYSSFLDLPPTAFGLPQWEEDDTILAAVLAASQQEYIDSLKQGSSSNEK